MNRGLLRLAEQLAQRAPATLEQRGLKPAFSDWLLTEDAGMCWLFGVLDVRQVERLEQYMSEALLHHLSTALGGLPVYLSNTSGLRYAVLLNKPPRLPKRVAFPGRETGVVQVGLRSLGGAAVTSWEGMGHALVAGMTGSGKSTFLRLLVYQALSEGARLLLADREGRTFPMLAEHPALLGPIAQTPQAVLELLDAARGECEHRSALYDEVGGFPDDLEEYNALALAAGTEPLPRLLVILDEYNATVVESGRTGTAIAEAAAGLGWTGRKYGVNLVFAAQDFTKRVVGAVRDQVSTVACFRVRNADTARNVGCAEAAQIKRPGLAVTDRWGPVQTYYLDKSALIAVGERRTAALPEEAARLARLAVDQGGRMTLGDLAQWGVATGERRRLLEEWRRRGWVEKDAMRGNAHYVTDRLVGLLGLQT